MFCYFSTHAYTMTRPSLYLHEFVHDVGFHVYEVIEFTGLPQDFRAFSSGKNESLPISLINKCPVSQGWTV